MSRLINLSRLYSLDHSGQLGKSDPTQILLSDLLINDQPLALPLQRIAPPRTENLRIEVDGNIQAQLIDRQTTTITLEAHAWILMEPHLDFIKITANTHSQSINEYVITLSFYDHDDVLLFQLTLFLTAIRVSLDVDSDRDGYVEQNNPRKHYWAWGSEGVGAILLVNNDRDLMRNGSYSRDRLNQRVDGPLDLKEMSPLIVRTEGPDILPTEYEMRLQVTDAAAEKVRVFSLESPGGIVILGPDTPQYRLSYKTGERTFYAEGLQYPDIAFSGLITVNLFVVRQEQPLFQDTVIFRVAPWIMTPNTLAPHKVYICDLPGGRNQTVIATVTQIARQVGVELTIVPSQVNRGDRWVQDEIEIGYSQGPQQILPVVLDSPRNRELDSFPKTALLGPNFGYVTRGADNLTPSSLDSFGNLEVSPPVTVGDVRYPLGRVIFGGMHPAGQSGRRMMKVVSDFLYAQLVQEPIEVYSDWLSIGHVDEFMTFVPVESSPGFKLLLASPDAAYVVLRKVRDVHLDGGALRMLKNKYRLDTTAEVSVNDVLNNRELRQQNALYQSNIDWNRETLKRELGLTEKDIIDIPVLFRREGYGAGAFFPDMVNMLVLGKHLVIPKPFGPEVRGQCQLEVEVERLLEPLGLVCHFVDTWENYHILGGEIHCGTNVWRHPSNYHWWETKPALRVDITVPQQDASFMDQLTRLIVSECIEYQRESRDETRERSRSTLCKLFEAYAVFQGVPQSQLVDLCDRHLNTLIHSVLDAR